MMSSVSSVGRRTWFCVGVWQEGVEEGEGIHRWYCVVVHIHVAMLAKLPVRYA